MATKRKYKAVPLDAVEIMTRPIGEDERHWFWDYRGYRIHISKQKCMAGYYLTYFDIFRKKDGYEFVCDFTEGSDTVTQMLGFMKDRVDDKIETKRPDAED